jgi:hypothetical protein
MNRVELLTEALATVVYPGLAAIWLGVEYLRQQHATYQQRK